MIKFPRFIRRIPEERRRWLWIAIGVVLLSSILLLLRTCGRPAVGSGRRSLQDLSSPSPERQIEAIHGLVRLRLKSAQPELEKLLVNDPEDRVRRAAAYALLALDPEGFRARLPAGQNDRVTIICLETLARQAREKALPELAELLRSGPVPVRQAALRELGSIGGAEAVEILLRLAEETRLDSQLQVEALVRLGEMAGLDAVERLTRRAEKESDLQLRRLILDTAARIEKRTRPDQPK